MSLLYSKNQKSISILVLISCMMIFCIKGQTYRPCSQTSFNTDCPSGCCFQSSLNNSICSQNSNNCGLPPISAGAIVGIVIGCLVLLIVIIIIIICIIKRIKKENPNPPVNRIDPPEVQPQDGNINSATKFKRQRSQDEHI